MVIRKNKNLILILLIILIAAVSGFLFLVMAVGFGNNEAEIKNLKAEQEGFKINVSWDEVNESNGYSVLVYEGLGLPDDYDTDTNSITIDKIDTDSEYDIVVSSLDEDGTVNGSAEITIETEKLSQSIEIDKKEIIGFVGDSATIKATAKGNISFKSSDDGAVSTTESGKVELKKSGITTVEVTALETENYKAETVKVKVKVVPDELGAVNLSEEESSDSTVSFTWTENEYATSYDLMWLNPATDSYETVERTGDDLRKVTVPRKQGEYAVKAIVKIGKKTVESDLSEGLKIEAASSSAKTYSSAHNIKELGSSDLETIALIHGTGSTKVPQSMCYNGSEYIISYVNHGGTVGKFVAYDKNGNKTRSVSASNMGHANGTTLNRNTGEICVAKTHKSIRTAASYKYKASDFSSIGSFSFPMQTSGIAYDPTNDKYYLSKGNRVYVTDNKFNVERTISKKARYNHAQDVGGYNGVCYVCTWVSGKTSYIDMYRTTDGAYLGSYYIPLGEIESCVVNDEGYLVILVNIKGTNDAYIYKMKERTPF